MIDYNYRNGEGVDNKVDWVRFIISLLAAIKLLVAALGFNFFTDDILLALENLVPLLVVLWGVWKNNYLTRKGKAQKAVLIERGLADNSNE